MNKLILLTSLIISMCGCSTYTITPYDKITMDKAMYDDTFVSEKHVTFNYRFYLPHSVRKLPLIIYLHGAGQRGDDNVSQLDVGVGSLLRITNEKDEYKSLIVAPQCPKDYFWRNEEMLDALEEFIVRILDDNDFIDRERVYITGYSMGGDATWKLALRCSDIISTIMPICGGPLESMEPDRPEVDEYIANLNIWAFNNFDDKIVRPNYSKYMFSKIWSYNINDNLNFTESIDGGHDATNIYRNRKYMIWFLSTKKEIREESDVENKIEEEEENKTSLSLFDL